MNNLISVLGLHYFDLKDSLRLTPRCRNMQKVKVKCSL